MHGIRGSERAALAGTRASEGTMNAFISASVGRVLDELSGQYPDALEEVTLVEGGTDIKVCRGHYDLVMYLRSEAFQDYASSHGCDAGRIEDMIAFLNAKVQEPVDHDLDTARFMVEDSSSGELRSIERLMPLQQVVGLVGQALLDDGAYSGLPIDGGSPIEDELDLGGAREIKEGVSYGEPPESDSDSSSELLSETLESDETSHARDRNDRIMTLVSEVVDRISGECHTGVRHALVLTLNHVYPGVELIETLDTYLLALREQHILEVLEQAKREDSQRYSQWVCAWVCDSMPESLQELLGSDEHLKEMRDTFTAQLVAHGVVVTTETGEEEPSVKKGLDMVLLKEVFQDISCPLSDDPVLHFVSYLLSCEPLGHSDRDRYVQALQAEFTGDEVPDITRADVQARIAKFYACDRLFRKIQTYGALLAGADGVELSPEDKTTVENYLAAYFRGDEVGVIPKAPFEQCRQALSQAQKDQHTSWIGNYFAHLFLDKTDLAARNLRLAESLGSPAYHSKIVVTDAWLRAVFQTDAAGLVHLEPYHINRILLHALLVPVSGWSPGYAIVLGTVLSFIEEKLVETAVGMHLKSTSYPDDLLALCKCLQGCYARSQTEPMGELVAIEGLDARQILEFCEGNRYQGALASLAIHTEVDVFRALVAACQAGWVAVVDPLLQSPMIDINARYRGKTVLVLAAKEGRAEVVERLLAVEGIDVNASNGRGYTALMVAAEAGHVEVVVRLLEFEGIEVNARNSDDRTALMVAARRGHVDVLTRLLEFEGMDVNARNSDDRTVLMEAAREGHVDVVEKLLAVRGIDVNASNGRGDTALVWAAERGDVELVERLLAFEGIDVNASGRYGNTALMLAARGGHASVVEKLLAFEGIDVNASNGRGDTALVWAAERGDVELVERLLAFEGIDVNVTDSDGHTALIWAAKGGHAEVVERLLAFEGIDVNASGRYGNTALMLAARGGHASVVEKLLAFRGIDVNASNGRDYTALIIAAQGGDVELVERLLAFEGINVNAQDEAGNTALIMAALRGDVELVERLLAFEGIDVNAPNGDGHTALIWAAKGGHAEVVERLLAFEGIDVNASGRYGNTALMLAARGGHASVVEKLLAFRGIDVNASNRDGNTALMLAVRRGHAGVVEKLVSREDIDFSRIDEGLKQRLREMCSDIPGVIERLDAPRHPEFLAYAMSFLPDFMRGSGPGPGPKPGHSPDS